MSSVSPVVTIPRLEGTGRVTQLRVLHSEWTKLRSLRSTGWSLLVGLLLPIAFPILFAVITSARWGHLSPREPASRPGWEQIPSAAPADLPLPRGQTP